MKALHVIPSVSPRRGGPSAAVGALARALSAVGVESSIVTTTDHGPDELDVPTDRWVAERGVRVRYFPRFSPRWRAVREFAYAAGFSEWARRGFREFDVVHVHALFSYLPSRAMTLCRRMNIPYVLRPLGLLEEWSLAQSAVRKRAFLTLCDAANVRAAMAVHFTSEREREVSRIVPESAGFVAPLGVDIPIEPTANRATARRALGIAEDECAFLFLSRWHPKKRIETLLQALASMRDDAWVLVLAGDGDEKYKAGILAEIRRLGLAAKVRLPGFVDGEAKRDAFAAADVFVLPSHSENFGIAVAEAMASGLPVVVSRGVALAADIGRVDAGWVVNDVESELGPTLARALGSPDERERRGKNAANVARSEYDWNRCARIVAGHYERIVGMASRA